MKIIQSQIKGVFTLEPQIFQDERGYFMESYNDKSFSRISGLNISFVQDNESKSNKDVLRGLHFQIPPYAQDKLVRVIKGSVLDVAVDIRTGSPTFGKYVTELLSEQNKKQFERSLKWNDPEINIEWKNSKPMLSEKDREIDASLSDFKDVFT